MIVSVPNSTAHDSSSRSARLHRALDHVMDKCGYGKDERSSGVPWTKPADEWSKNKAAEMFAAGYDPRTIIEKLEAYGIGYMSAQALVRELQQKQPAGDSAYCLTARDEGFLRSILEGATEAVRSGLGAMTPSD